MKASILLRVSILAVAVDLILGIPNLLSNPQSVDSYVVFAQDEIVIGHDVDLRAGDLGANGAVTLRERAITSPSASIRADRIQLGPKVTVGKLHYNALQAHPTATIGSKTFPLTLPVITDFPETEAADPGSEDVVVEANDILMLDPGRYQHLVVKPNGTLILPGGRYDFASFRLFHNTCVIVDDDAELVIAEDMIIGNRCVVNHTSSKASMVIRFAGRHDVQIRSATRVRAVIVAPSGSVILGHDVVFEGRIAANRVHIRSRARITFNPFNSSQPPLTTPEAFTLFAQTRLTIETAAEILEGQIGSNGMTNHALEFHRNASTAPEVFLFSDRLTLDAGVVVGHAFFNRSQLHRTAIILDPHSPIVTPIVDVFPKIPPFTPGSIDLSIPKNATRVIHPGAYRDIQIGKNASVTFQPGEYRIRRLTIDKASVIRFTDFTSLSIKQSLTVGQDVRFNETLPRRDVRIFYDGDGAIKIESGGVLSISRLLAPKAMVSLAKNSAFAGTVWADKIEIGQNSVIKVFDVTPPETVAVPPGGMYNQDQFVELLAEEPADIFFTTDGSEPTSSSSRFTDPIEIVENTTLRFFGVDDSANLEDPNAELYVIDTNPPVIAIGGVSNGQITGDAVTPAITVSDENLAAVTILLNGHEYTVGTPIIVEGDHSLFVSANDLAGNTSTHSVDFTIDKTPPILIMPSDVALECPADTSPSYTGQAAAEDVCGVPTITSTDRVTAGCGATIAIVRTWVAIDHCGNTASADQTITLADTRPATLMGVPADLTIECGTIPPPPVVTAADSCDPNSVVTFSELIEGGSQFPLTIPSLVSVITRTWTVVDACGNATTAMQTLTVLDTNAPEITLLGDNPQRFECPESYVESGATAADSCDGDISVAIVIDSSSVNPSVSGEYSVAYSVTDTAGNMASVTRVVTVVDTTPPNLTGVPADLSVECGAIPVPAVVTATDSCDPSPVVTFTESTQDGNQLQGGSPPRRTILRTWIATDAFGNTSTATQTIMVLDTTPPVMTLLGDDPQIVECSETYVESGATATDSCDGDLSAELVIDSGSVDVSVLGTYSVAYSVTDAVGNSVSITRTVTVADTTPPTLIGVPADLTVECGEIPDPAVVTAVDSCDSNPIVTFTESTQDGNQLQGGSPPRRTILRNWTAVDASGNSITATQILMVLDTTPPTITLLGNNPEFLECSDSYIESGAIAPDSCDGDLSADIIIDASAIDVSAPGEYSVTYTVADAASNSASVTRVVTVVDTTPPTLVGVPADLTVECGTIPEAAIVTASDFCDPSPAVIFSETASDEVCFPATIVRTWTSRDASGNESSAQQTLSVIDTTPPTISVTGIADEDVTDQEVTPVIDVSDPCQPPVGECQLETTILLDDNPYEVDTVISAPGEHVLSVTSVDPSGNSATAIVHFTIESTNPLLRDSDGDGLTDIEEIEYETDPLNPDSDSDGFDDATEIANGTDPAPPRDVTNVETASFANDSVTIRWTHSTSDDIAGYLYHIDPSATLFDIGFVNELTLPRPPGANSISGAIHARDRVGNTTHSSPFYATWPDGPQPPASLSAYYDHPNVILILGRSPTAAVDKYIIDYDAFDLQGNLLADNVPIQASPYSNWTGDQALRSIEVNGLVANRKYLFRALSLDLGTGYAGGIASDPTHSPTAEVTTSDSGFINLAELKRDISARQISLYMDRNNNNIGGEISATVWNEALGSVEQELIPVRNSLADLGNVIYSEGKDYQTCNVEFIEESYSNCQPHINFQAVYQLDGWEHVLLPNDLGASSWLLGSDLNGDNVPDRITDGHRDEVESAFALLTTWIHAPEGEIVGSVTDQVVITHSVFFFGNSDDDEFSFDWWADRFGTYPNTGPQYHPQYWYFKLIALVDGEDVGEPLNGTSTVKTKAKFHWKPLSSMIDVEAVRSVNFGKIKLGESQEITYSFHGSPPVGDVNSFVSANLSVCDIASGDIGNSPPYFDYRFFKQMKDQEPELESVTYTANAAAVSASLLLIVKAGQRVIIHATAHYRIDLAVGPIYFDVPMPIKLKSTGGLAKVIQPSTFVAIKEGFEYEVIADLPGDDMTDAVAKIVVPKVDLDIDADNDGNITEGDDSIEASVGGVVCVGGRTVIKLSKVEPSTWTETFLLSKSSSKIKVFNSPTSGSELVFDGNDNKYSNSMLPTTLYVEGLEASNTPGDMKLEFISVSSALRDEISLTVITLGAIEGPSVICFGDSVAYNINPVPNGTSFPLGQPIWEITGAGAFVLGGSVGKSSVIITIGGLSVSPDIIHTIIVTCGGITRTLNVAVTTLESITFSDIGICTADSNSSIAAITNSFPFPGRPIVWAIIGNSLGATISGSGVITAGSTPGLITIRASDAVLPNCTVQATVNLQQYTEIAGDLEECENRIARPNAPVTANGCGPEGSPVVVNPPPPFNNAIVPCCNQHDNDWGTCNVNAVEANHDFFNCMLANCNNNFVPDTAPHEICLTIASAYLAAVSLGDAIGIYESAQKEACVCCESPQ